MERKNPQQSVWSAGGCGGSISVCPRTVRAGEDRHTSTNLRPTRACCFRRGLYKRKQNKKRSYIKSRREWSLWKPNILNIWHQGVIAAHSCKMVLVLLKNLQDKQREFRSHIKSGGINPCFEIPRACKTLWNTAEQQTSWANCRVQKHDYSSITTNWPIG